MCKKFVTSFGNTLKGCDQFGIPVQLTYKGQSSFQTILGGLVSLILVIVFAVGFFVQFYEALFKPAFFNYPPRYDFSETHAVISPREGNTLAVAVQVFNETDELDADKEVRVKFLGPLAKRIDAVYCADFYKDEIEQERNGTVKTNYFTDIFGNGNELKWICPDIEQFEIDYNYGLSASVVQCNLETEAKYADSEECLPYSPSNVTIWTRLVSSNFDPDLYN